MNRFSVALLGLSLAASAVAQHRPIRLTGGAPGYVHSLDVPKDFIRFGADSAQDLTTGGLPVWTGVSNGITYRMLGGNPTTGGATTLPVVFIPLVFHVGGHTFDPTKPANGSTKTPIQLMEQSPIFQPVDLRAGTVDLGANQWIDNFQRANFWTATGAGANNYHLVLGQPLVKSAITLNVPSSYGTTLSTGAGPVGDVDVNWFQSAINSILANSSVGVNKSQFVIFVYYNTFFYQGQSANCCILGFHGNTSSGIIYSASAYNDGGIFSMPAGQFLQDVTVITHEIGEAVDDPFVSGAQINIVPPFGNIGQVSGCQNNLEAGDPVTGIAATVPMPNGVTYHPEDLVFHGWFTREARSSSVNGWYTLLNSFHGNAKVCPPGGTN